MRLMHTWRSKMLLVCIAWAILILSGCSAEPKVIDPGHRSVTPRVNRVSPNHAAGQVQVLVEGANFLPGVMVAIGGYGAEVKRVDDSRLAVVVPPSLAPGTYDIQ